MRKMIGGSLAHPDEVGGLVPETGALAAAVQAITGRPVASVGKPGRYLFELAMRAYGVTADESVMVGDNGATDNAGAEQVGMRSIWID